MRTLVFFCWCIALALLLARPACAEQASLAEAARIMREQPKNTEAIAAALSRGLAKQPDSVLLLQARADLYCSRGLLALCRADAQRILQVRPEAVESLLLLCMLDELEGSAPESCAPCYEEAATRFAARLAFTPQEKMANVLNRVIALLLARHPDAEKEKAALLASGVSHPLLQHIDRKRALHSIFGEVQAEQKISDD